MQFERLIEKMKETPNGMGLILCGEPADPNSELHSYVDNYVGSFLDYLGANGCHFVCNIKPPKHWPGLKLDSYNAIRTVLLGDSVFYILHQHLDLVNRIKGLRFDWIMIFEDVNEDTPCIDSLRPKTIPYKVSFISGR